MRDRCAVPRNLFQCVCTQHRNRIGRLSPFSEYAPTVAPIKPDSWNHRATVKRTRCNIPSLPPASPQDSFSAVAAAPPRSLQSKNAPAALLELADTCREHTKAPRGWIFSDQGRCGKTADPTVCPSGSKFLVSPYKAPQDKSVPKTSALTAATTRPALPDL